MKILHIGKFYPPFHGGMENYLRDLARAQTKQGHQVLAWVHNHEWQIFTAQTSRSSDGDVQLIRQKTLRPILFAPIMLRFGGQLNAIIKEHQPDLIHLHWPNPSVFKLLWHRESKSIPWVISWHSDMVTANSSWLMKFIYFCIKPLETLLIKRAKSILVSTQSYANHSKQLIKFAAKTTVIPLGLDTKQIDQLAFSSNSKEFQQVNQLWHDDQFRLLHLGRLTFYKNQKFLIQAMKKQADTQLVIAGEGQLESQLNQLVKQLELTEQVSLLGGVSWPQAHALFSSCDVFCLASHDRAESFGVVLLEAMYHNRIILVPDTLGSGMQCLARNYNKGFVYEVNNEADFLEKLQHIQSNLTAIMAKAKQFEYPIEGVAESIHLHYLHQLSGEKP